MRKNLIHLLLSATITLILLAAVSQEVSYSEFIGLLSGVNMQGVLLFAALSSTALIFRAARYRWLIEDCSENQESPSLASLVVITAMRNAFVDFLPARLGESVWFYAINRYGVSLVKGAAVFGLCLLYDLLVVFILLLGLIVFELYSSSTDLGFSSPSWAILPISFLVASFWLLLAKAPELVALGSRLFSLTSKKLQAGRIARGLEGFSEKLHALSLQLASARSLGHSLRVFIATMALRFLKYLSLYILLISVLGNWEIEGLQLSPLRCTLAFLAGEAAASLPISGLMGFGAYEGAWSLVFSGIGGQTKAITSVIFAVHIITQVVGYFWGLLGATVFSIKMARETKLSS